LSENEGGKRGPRSKILRGKNPQQGAGERKERMGTKGKKNTDGNSTINGDARKRKPPRGGDFGGLEQKKSLANQKKNGNFSARNKKKKREGEKERKKINVLTGSETIKKAARENDHEKREQS